MDFPEHLLQQIPEGERENIIEILAQDPRTAYIHDETREWGVSYAGYNVLFYVKDNVLSVCGVEKLLD